MVPSRSCSVRWLLHPCTCPAPKPYPLPVDWVDGLSVGLSHLPAAKGATGQWTGSAKGCLLLIAPVHVPSWARSLTDKVFLNGHGQVAACESWPNFKPSLRTKKSRSLLQNLRPICQMDPNGSKWKRSSSSRAEEGLDRTRRRPISCEMDLCGNMDDVSCILWPLCLLGIAQVMWLGRSESELVYKQRAQKMCEGSHPRTAPGCIAWTTILYDFGGWEQQTSSLSLISEVYNFKTHKYINSYRHLNMLKSYIYCTKIAKYASG